MRVIQTHDRYAAARRRRTCVEHRRLRLSEGFESRIGRPETPRVARRASMPQTRLAHAARGADRAFQAAC
ncbi:hypothetical protein D7S86_01790 [Pararobbsia silviterrae]|uniref:Uncharacterized protein n=1 Tax=Pararobbsia silviterrae TaxID=1792498 RepID=A0A494Y8I4_9BURK|nr:hypothetical protein D7S86_01790 [Pararobbsia silviterrae]